MRKMFSSLQVEWFCVSPCSISSLWMFSVFPSIFVWSSLKAFFCWWVGPCVQVVTLHITCDISINATWLGVFSNYDFIFLLPVHEALEDFAGPELIHLSDHIDAHVSVSTQQPSHVFPVTWRTEKPNVNNQEQNAECLWTRCIRFQPLNREVCL